MLTLKFQRIQRTVLTCLGRRTHLGTSIKDIRSSFSTKGDVESIATILNRVKDGDLSVEGAESQLQQIALQKTNESDLQSFANLDHKRAWRTGFPEAVFASGKTAQQVCAILDDMALNVNNLVGKEKSNTDSGVVHIAHKAILATRVDQQLYEDIMKIPLKYGTIKYHEMAKIISVKASGEANSDITPEHKHGKVVVACAGTTDMPVAEEASITLEAAGCDVERIYDVGVAGLHRIINALPKLRHPDVDCVIVCAGMDGALPSVVGGLVSVPVIAVPTSIGYGASFNGISAMLTMLNSCSPGVGVVNIDNGFGGAALAFKCIKKDNDGNSNKQP